MCPIYGPWYYYMCPHTATYVSSYCYICVFILLYMCSQTTMYVSSNYYIGVLVLPYVSSYYYICFRTLLHKCPDTTICVLILRYRCPRTTLYMSLYYYICFLILLYMRPHATVDFLGHIYRALGHIISSMRKYQDTYIAVSGHMHSSIRTHIVVRIVVLITSQRSTVQK